MPTVRETTLSELDRAHRKPPMPMPPEPDRKPSGATDDEPTGACVVAAEAKPRHRSARRVVLA
jgi:hypothetical protein